MVTEVLSHIDISFLLRRLLGREVFHMTSRRKKIKVLPRGEHEQEGAAKLIRLEMCSSRFPFKSIFMGVVARPLPHRNFDGKIMLERVSEQVTVTRLGSYTNFADDTITNSTIRNEEW